MRPRPKLTHFTLTNLNTKEAFTIIEVLIAFSIFTIIMGLVLVSVTGSFRSLHKAETILTQEQKQRLCMFRLSREIASFTKIVSPQVRFKGDEHSFHLICAKEDNLVETAYAYNPTSQTLEHYYEEPADFNWDTYQTKETCLGALSDCRFNYSDGLTWLTSWDEKREDFPRAIKISFRFINETNDREFIVNIPISQ